MSRMAERACLCCGTDFLHGCVIGQCPNMCGQVSGRVYGSIDSGKGNRSMKMILHLVPLLLLVVCIVGIGVCAYKRDRINTAILGLTWCEAERVVMKNDAGGIACAAYRQSTVDNDNLEPLLAFYRNHPKYDPLARREP